LLITRKFGKNLRSSLNKKEDRDLLRHLFFIYSYIDINV
jgi:hypothetical protein